VVWWAEGKKGGGGRPVPAEAKKGIAQSSREKGGTNLLGMKGKENCTIKAGKR